MSLSLRVDLLGETLLRRGNTVVSTGGPRRAAIVAMLALRAPRSVSRPELEAGVWGAHPPASAVNTLHVHISALRRTLGQAAIETAGQGYRLGAGVAVDVLEFRHAAGRGAEELARGEAGAAAETLRRGLDLWRGPALADLGEAAFAAADAALLEEMRLNAIEDRIQADLILGRHREVIGELIVLVADNPLREGLRGQLMKALYRAGRQAQALAVYDSGRRLLRDELGLDPSAALRELHHLLLIEHADEAVLRSVSGTPSSHLPALLDETIGREAEIAKLTGLLVAGPARLVTVLGPGGVGKTRLAVAIGERAMEVLPDGALFVSLAQADKGADVAITICAALQLRTLDDPLETLESALRTRRMLLICDNFEHVLDAAWILPRLLGAAPGVRILVTSRQKLGLRGERCFPLCPLPTESSDGRPSPAALLFLDRAATVDVGFVPTVGDLDDIAEIAKRCDGLPLALELAAAHIRALPVAELRKQLDSPLALLVGESWDVVDRPRTLRASIGWSMSALEASHAQLLAQWTVFRGGFTLTSAAAIGGVDADAALGCIYVLLDHNLLMRTRSIGGTPRFHMLQTIRDYAAELLSAEEREEARRRHVDYYRFWIKPLDEPGKFAANVATWLAQLAERANLRQAIRWSLAGVDAAVAADLVMGAAPVWDHVGPRGELLEWLEQVLDRPGVSPARRCDAYWWQAALLADSAAGLMVAPLNAARQLAEGIADNRRLSWVHLLCAVCEFYREQSSQATEQLSLSAALAARHPDAVNLQISLLMATGHMSTVQGNDLGSAREDTEKALALARSHHHDLRAMTLLNNMSEIMLVRIEPERAREFADAGLELAVLAQSQDGIAANLSQRGYASLLSGKVAEALSDLHAALNGHLQLGTLYYALHDCLRLAAALSELHPRLAALAFGVVQACPTFVHQASSIQAKDRFLVGLETRLDTGLAPGLAQGQELVARHGENGALAAVLELTAKAVTGAGIRRR